jgi:hypothetical protein
LSHYERNAAGDRIVRFSGREAGAACLLYGKEALDPDKSGTIRVDLFSEFTHKFKWL